MGKEKKEGISPVNCMQWFEHLNHAIVSTRAVIENQPASFEAGLERVAQVFKRAMADASSIWWVGNGGSAAVCSHLAQDAMNKLKVKSLYIGDSSLMTCMANDFGYEQVYSRPLDQLAEKRDVLIAISSSGNSENILNCVSLGEKKEMETIVLSGMKENNRLFNSKSTVGFYLPSDLYGIVEVGHEAILHGLIETLWLEINPTE